MATPRRKCRLSATDHADIDLRDYSRIIIETIEQVVPGKNPKVFKEYFSTDVLSQSESVRLGRMFVSRDELEELLSDDDSRIYLVGKWAAKAKITPTSRRLADDTPTGRGENNAG